MHGTLRVSKNVQQKSVCGVQQLLQNSGSRRHADCRFRPEDVGHHELSETQITENKISANV